MSASPEILAFRARLIQSLRLFLVQRGYLEVETPIRLPQIIPEKYIVPLQSDGWFLQSSPELCMKRLMANGLSKIFQVCRCFRKGERGRFHLPEMTMLEWYCSEMNYLDLMNECEELVGEVAQQLGIGDTLSWQGFSISLAGPWNRLTVTEAFQSYAPVALEEALAQGIFDEVLVEHIEPHLGKDRPTFLFDYPASLGSLAALKEDDPSKAQRFELYIGGLELANGFTELVDPVEQRRRFELEQKAILSMGQEPSHMPEKFLQDLKRMPKAAGIAMGVDRLLLLFSGCQSIDQVVAFSPESL